MPLSSLEALFGNAPGKARPRPPAAGQLLLSVALFLLGFFMLLVSLAESDAHHARAVRHGVQASFHGDGSAVPASGSRGDGADAAGWHLEGRLAGMVKALLRPGTAIVSVDARTLRLRFPATALFDGDRAEPTADTLDFFDQVVAELSAVPAGMTADVEIGLDPRAPLARERAAALAAGLVARGGDSGRITVLLTPGDSHGVTLTFRIRAETVGTASGAEGETFGRRP